GECADKAVVSARHVPRASRLGDLRVMQLGCVAIDVEDAAPEPLERLDHEVLEHGLLGRARADAVTADGVEADDRRAVARRPDENREACEDVLEDGGPVPKSARE